MKIQGMRWGRLKSYMAAGYTDFCIAWADILEAVMETGAFNSVRAIYICENGKSWTINSPAYSAWERKGSITAVVILS